MLKPLWLHLEEISERLRSRERLTVACDFDGTLTEIVPRPDLAKLSDRTRSAIEAVARLPGAEVGIFSGRMLDELSHRVPMDGLFLSGLAGLETLDRQGRRHLHVRAEQTIPEAMRDTRREWRGHVTWFLEWLAREWPEGGGKGIAAGEATSLVEAGANGGDGAPEPAAQAPDAEPEPAPARGSGAESG